MEGDCNTQKAQAPKPRHGEQRVRRAWGDVEELFDGYELFSRNVERNVFRHQLSRMNASLKGEVARHHRTAYANDLDVHAGYPGYFPRHTSCAE